MTLESDTRENTTHVGKHPWPIGCATVIFCLLIIPVCVQAAEVGALQSDPLLKTNQLASMSLLPLPRHTQDSTPPLSV